MNLRQMEAFRLVMLAGSVSDAAQRLFKTQSAVSMNIAALEEQLGFPLFERRKKRLYPTPEAKYLYTELEAIVGRMQELTETLKDIRNKQQGVLRCMPGPSYVFMPDLVADFLDDYPGVQVSLQTPTSESILEWTASAQYDVALAEIGGPDPSIEVELFDMECVCAVPAGHRLAREPVLTPALLADEPMIALYPDHSTAHALSQVFDAAQCRLNVRVRTRFFIPALRFVERGQGICLLDPITVASYGRQGGQGVVFKPFKPVVPFRVGLLHPAHQARSQITQEFTERLRASLAALLSEV